MLQLLNGLLGVLSYVLIYTNVVRAATLTI